METNKEPDNWKDRQHDDRHNNANVNFVEIGSHTDTEIGVIIFHLILNAGAVEFLLADDFPFFLPWTW